jgi:hypothetical protein
MVSALRMPTASTFFDHVVAVLGHLTGFYPHAYIDHHKVIPLVLERAKIDPDQCPWPMTGKPSVKTTIGFAHRNQRVGYTKVRTPLTELGGPGMWGLTAEGVQRAKQLAMPPEMPDAAHFRTPLLSVLGRLTDYGKNYTRYEEVKTAVLKAAGFDLDNLPEDWPRTGRTGLPHRVTRIFRRLKEGDDPLTHIEKQYVWGLTKAGAQAAREINGEMLPMPKTAAFTDAVLAMLGKATEFDHRREVPADDLRQNVLDSLGYDLDDLPVHWNAASLPPRVTSAFRSLSPKFTRVAKRGMWGLTRRGVKKARRLAQNVTTRWIDKQGSGFLSYLVDKVGRKLPVSKTLGVVEDHVHNYLRKAIDRDAFNKPLSEGKLPWSKVVSYTVRSAYTDIRGEGTDAHCRTLRGSLTEQNRKKMAETGVDDRRIPWTDPRVVLSRDDHGGVLQDMACDMFDANWFDDKIDTDRAEDALATMLSNQYSNDYAAVYDLVLNDHTSHEIAKALDISHRMSTTMATRVRQFTKKMMGDGVAHFMESPHVHA